MFHFNFFLLLEIASPHLKVASAAAPLVFGSDQEVGGLMSLPVGATRALHAEVVTLPSVHDKADFATVVGEADTTTLSGVAQTVEVGHWEPAGKRAVKVVARLQDAHGNSKIAPRTVSVTVAVGAEQATKACDVQGGGGATKDCAVGIPDAWFGEGGAVHTGSEDARVTVTADDVTKALGKGCTLAGALMVDDG